MIKLNKEELRDKIYACWLGKNIGGTLGAPFEGKRQVNDCKGYTTKPGTPLPNDDLDLQLVWLKAMYEVGPYALNSKVLGEYWIEYIVPYWGEYGNSKSNMRSGLVPPISGQFENIWKHSNGAWIRTEIWATLFPGNVEKTVAFAFEDASVDHGVGDGTYAAIFVAAMESAAFLIQDIRELIKIGLSNIPEGCRFHRYITTAVECYDSGLTWLEARNKLTDMSLEDPGLGWFQAPANVGYAIIGLLYGEGDFKETILIACNCGDDTDCSCATAGSLLGIMHGTKIIPKDWQEYIGDSIVTISLNVAAIDTYHVLNEGSYALPKTCAELTDTVMRLHPIMLHAGPVEVVDTPTETDASLLEKFYGDKLKLKDKTEYFAVYKSTLVKATVELFEEPTVKELQEKKVRISLRNNFLSQKYFVCDWRLPEGWSVCGRRSIALNSNMHEEEAQSEFIITAGTQINPKNTLILAITCDGHHDVLSIPIIFLG